MNKESKVTKVAAVQIAPVAMDSMATAEKVCDYIKKAASEGAQLILFPKPCFPAIHGALPLLFL